MWLFLDMPFQIQQIVHIHRVVFVWVCEYCSHLSPLFYYRNLETMNLLQHIQKLQERVLWGEVWQWGSFAYMYCIQKYMKMQKFGKRKKLHILPLIFNLSYHEIHNYIPFSFYSCILYSSWNYSYKNRLFWKPYGSNSNIRKRQSYNWDFRRFSVSCMYQFS